MRIPLLRDVVFGLLFLFSGNERAFGQNPQSIDSLKKALIRYDNVKKSKGIKDFDLRDSVMVNIYQKLASSFMGNDLKQSLFYTNKQLEISKKINFKKGTALAYNNLGSICDMQSDNVHAIKYFKESLRLSKEIGDKCTEANANGNIGAVLSNQSNFNEALKYMLRSLAISKSIKDKNRIATVYNNIGVLYMKQNNPVLALNNYFSCLKMMEELGDKPAMAVISNNIGQIYAMKGNPDEAIIYLKKGLMLSIQVNDKESIANNNRGLGNAYIEKQQYEKALGYYQLALKLNEELGDKIGIVRSYLTMGRVYFLMGIMNKSIQIVNKLHVLLRPDEIEQWQNVYELESKIYQSKKDYKRAFESQLKFKELSDSIYNSETKYNFDQLKIKYDFKSAQDSITDIQVKKDIIAKAEIKNQRTKRNFLLLAMGLVVVFLIIIIWQRNKIAIVRRQKALEAERNRISRDLHDNLGTQLSTVRMFVSSLKKGRQDISETVDNSIGLLDTSISDLRGIMQEMNSSVLLENGYLVATEMLINKVNLLHTMQFSLTHHKMEERLDAEKEHQLYRITQELVNNTLKYAKAKNVSIDILRRDGNLILMYEDDGVGFDIDSIKKGYGLQNIETRAKSLHGTVVFDSMPNAGARTIVEIPLHHG